MKIDYVVHSAVVERVPVTAMIGDRQVEALVDGLTIELVGGDSDHGHTFRFVPHGAEDMAEHRAMFTIGNKVTATFTGEDVGNKLAATFDAGEKA